MKYGFAVRMCCLLLLLLSTACGSDSAIRKKSDTIIIALSTEPVRLNPLFLTDFNSYAVSELIFRGLVKLDHKMKVTPDMAKSWEIRDSGREIIFHLKENILWHDGKNFTAEDVVFTYEKIVSPKTATPQAGRFGTVKNVRVIDKYTVSVRYSEPYGSALESWTIGIIPKHIFQDKEDINDSSFDSNPIGTGPYRLKEWRRGQMLKLEAFRDFYNGKPKIDNLIILIIPDAASRMFELQSGGVDVMELSPEQYRYDKNYEKYFNKFKADAFRYGFLGLNLRDDRFKDKRVRQALDCAIDKQAIIKIVLNGLGKISTGPYPSVAWYHNSSVQPQEYNPAKALRLLEVSGWKRNSQGVLEKNGKPFSFTILTNYESKENIKTAQLIQYNLKAIGIMTEIVQLEWMTFRYKTIGNRHFEAVVMSRAYLWDPDIYDLWHSSKTKEGEWNFLSYKNAELDTLLDKGRKTIDANVRRQIYQRVHSMLFDDKACIFLYETPLLFIAHKSIKGVKPSPKGFFHNAEEWYLDMRGN